MEKQIFTKAVSYTHLDVYKRQMRKLAAEHPSEKVGKEIRKLYSWNGQDKLLDN